MNKSLWRNLPSLARSRELKNQAILPARIATAIFIAKTDSAEHRNELKAIVLSKVFLRINGRTHYLWRAVDQDGNVLDILVQSKRDKQAARKFFRNC